MDPIVVDRYELSRELASGGMATVFLGRLRGGSGFARTVAIKRMHKHLTNDLQLVASFLDEARLAARIRHPNVVSTLDVIDRDGEMLIVMDYVHGETLSQIRNQLIASGRTMPLPIIGAIVSGILQGLHAAHEAKDERGIPLGIVHRDVSPQNVLVGIDGVARVVDFGIAKATDRLQHTTEGIVKGKAAYMAPEQLGGTVDRRTDVFAASIILWELLTQKRLFAGATQAETMANVLAAKVPSVREIDPSIPEALDEVLLAGLDPVPSRRFNTAREMDQALNRCIPIASTFDVSEWLATIVHEQLDQKTQALAELETSPVTGSPRIEKTEPTQLAIVPERPSRVRPLWFALGAVVAILLIAGGVAFSMSHEKARAEVPTPSASVIAPAASSATVIATPPSTGSPSASVVATNTAPTASQKRPVAAVKPKVDCDPPYVVDSRGKHFKPECL
jgi:eukaryotic-like serine/threonine-protein kinase